VQSALAATGHYRGAVNGRYGSELRQAIEAFERSELLVPTGLVSADLVGRLQTVVALRQRRPQDAAKAPQIETGSNPAAPADKR
jgi:peptidoglycan hydrolase-like protein with peptidoglycan-binding domain